MLVNSNTKDFEKPKSGLYLGVLADVVNLGPIFNKKFNKTSNMVRLVWILNAKDKEGNFFRVMRQVTATMSEKSNLFAIVKDMIQSVPALPYELEDLIGRNNQLVVSLDTAADGKQYANVKAILAPNPGTSAFAVPQGFVRSKDKKQQQASQPAAQQSAPAQAAVSESQEISDEDIPF